MSRWYIIHAYSGFENKVRDAILSEAKRLGLEQLVEAVEVPTETVTEIRAPTIVRVETGASCRRRSSLLCRHPCSVAAAPKLALIAMAHPSRPGVTYSMVCNDSSSTRSTSRE